MGFADQAVDSEVPGTQTRTDGRRHGRPGGAPASSLEGAGPTTGITGYGRKEEASTAVPYRGTPRLQRLDSAPAARA